MKDDMDNKDNKDSNESKKTLCNRCMSDITGIKEEDSFESINRSDIAEIFSHMTFSLHNACEKTIEENMDMTLVYLEYIQNDIMNIQQMLGIHTCNHDHDDEEHAGEDM